MSEEYDLFETSQFELSLHSKIQRNISICSMYLANQKTISVMEMDEVHK
jgi:hypothetical protein